MGQYCKTLEILSNIKLKFVLVIYSVQCPHSVIDRQIDRQTNRQIDRRQIDRYIQLVRTDRQEVDRHKDRPLDSQIVSYLQSFEILN